VERTGNPPKAGQEGHLVTRETQKDGAGVLPMGLVRSHPLVCIRTSLKGNFVYHRENVVLSITPLDDLPIQQRLGTALAPP